MYEYSDMPESDSATKGHDSSEMAYSRYGEYGSVYEGEIAGPDEEPEEEIDLSQVSTRMNLSETAFFFPHLLTDGEGQVSITFTIPEALTAWKFMGFAHVKDLLWGMLSEETVTQKDLMVQANPPRFFREGDILFL